MDVLPDSAAASLKVGTSLSQQKNNQADAKKIRPKATPNILLFQIYRRNRIEAMKKQS